MYYEKETVCEESEVAVIVRTVSLPADVEEDVTPPLTVAV